MTNQTRDVIALFMLLVYNGLILAGTTYLVAFQDWSAWWFLLSVLLLTSKFKTNDD